MSFFDFLGGVANNVEHFFGGGQQQKRPQQKQFLPYNNQPQTPGPATAPRVPAVMGSAPRAGFTPAPAFQLPRPPVQAPTPPAASQHPQNLFAQIGNSINQNVVKPAVQTYQKTANTEAVPITGLLGEGAAALDKVIEGGQHSQAILNATRGAMNQQLAHSLVPQNVVTGKATPAQFAGSIAKTGVNIAPWLVGGGGGLAAKVGTNVLEKTGSAALAKAAQLGAAFGTNSGTFGGLNLASQVTSGQRVDPLQALRTGLAAGAMGLGGELVGKAASAGAGGVRNVARSLPANAGAREAWMLANAPEVGSEALSGASTSKLPVKQQNVLQEKSPAAHADGNFLTKGLPPTVQKPTLKLPEPLDEHPINTAKPVTISKVHPGDFSAVRGNAQSLESMVNNHALGVIRAMNKLTPEERTNFWKAQEDPSLAHTPQMQEALDRWQNMADTVHATSTALGGDTKYVANYARHNWDLSDPAQKELYDHLAEQRALNQASSADFHGLDNRPRVFNTINEGEAAGFKLKNVDPRKDVEAYAKSSVAGLKRQAIVKGMEEADTQQPLRQWVDLRDGGDPLRVSAEGAKGIRSLIPSSPSGNKVIQDTRAANKDMKTIVLGPSQFHPINVNMQAAPALALKGHPIMAAKGVFDSAKSLNKNYADKLQQQALHDGTIEAAAKMMTPINHGSDFGTEGKMSLHSSLGENVIFKQQIPAMHYQMVHAAKDYLDKKGIAYDSKTGRDLGTAINEIMGFRNNVAHNSDPRSMRLLSDALLAPQFTATKWATLGRALTKGGPAGSYARAAVLGKYGAQVAGTTALGALLGQKSDNVGDTLKRDLIHPSIPTPLKDGKGNTLELGMPSNYFSEALGLGASLTRDKSGRLQVGVNPENIPGNIANYGRARLSVLPADALKVATNTDYAGKPLYDPNASLSTKVQQAAGTTLSNSLPIGLQGLLRESAVNKSLPTGMQQVLNANSKGGAIDPLVASAMSAFGLTPRTDKTVGQGLSTTQYFNAVDQAKRGLNSHEQDALDMNIGSKKNPVTGQYDVMPNANDTRTKATALLDQPKALDHLIAMNQQLKAQGQTTDPLYSLSKDQITKYLQYEAMAPASADRAKWQQENGSWYKPLTNQRNVYFNTLPPGDPNRPQLNIKPPTETPQLTNLMSQYDSLGTPAAKAQFINANPQVSQYFNAMTQYDNQMRVAQGYDALRTSPTASATVQQYMNNYMAANKAQRTQMRTGDPANYMAMQNYMAANDRANLDKQAAIDQLLSAGQNPNAQPSQSYMKSAYGLGQYDIGKTTNPNGTTSYNFGGNATYAAQHSGSGTKAAKVRTPKAAKNPFVTKSGLPRGTTRSSLGKIKLPKLTTPKIAQGMIKVPKASENKTLKMNTRSTRLGTIRKLGKGVKLPKKVKPMKTKF